MSLTPSATAGFQHHVRVYWEDTDAGGVVYHAQYLAFMERARSEWMRAIGFGQEALREANLQFVVRSMAVDFRRPARLDDWLSVSVRLAQCRGASLVIQQEVRRGDERLVGAEVRVAAVSADRFRPVPIPEAVLARLEPESP